MCSDNSAPCQPWFSYTYSDDFSYTNCSLFGIESSSVPGKCTTGRWMNDRGKWDYLGGWSVLQKQLKNDSLRFLSHVWGSPMSLGVAVEQQGRNRTELEGKCPNLKKFLIDVCRSPCRPPHWRVATHPPTHLPAPDHPSPVPACWHILVPCPIRLGCFKTLTYFF